MGNGHFSKQETGDKTISPNCRSRVMASVLPIQTLNYEFCSRWDISYSDSIHAKPKASFVLDSVSVGAGALLSLTIPLQELFASVFYRLCKTLLINWPKGCCCGSLLSPNGWCVIFQSPLSPFSFFIQEGRKWKMTILSIFSRLLYLIIFPVHHIQFVETSALLKIAKLLWSKGILCLLLCNS